MPSKARPKGKKKAVKRKAKAANAVPVLVTFNEIDAQGDIIRKGAIERELMIQSSEHLGFWSELRRKIQKAMGGSK